MLITARVPDKWVYKCSPESGSFCAWVLQHIVLWWATVEKVNFARAGESLQVGTPILPEIYDGPFSHWDPPDKVHKKGYLFCMRVPKKGG